MEARAYIKNVKMTPKKLRFLLHEVKKLTPQQALERLLYVEKKPARVLLKAIESAVQNAKQVLKTDESKLIFKTLTVEEGNKIKRLKAGGRGMAKPYVRRYAHIKIILTAQKPLPTEEKIVTQPKKEAQDKSKVKSKKI